MVREPEHDPVDGLVEVVRAGDQLTDVAVQPVMAMLRIWLAKRRLDEQDLEDVSLQAITRLIEVARVGQLDADRPAGAWLRVVADHLAIDALRKRQRSNTVPLDENQAVDDLEDPITALVNRSVATSEVRRALRTAATAGQHDVVRVVITWLGLAAANGEAPSSRQVGERLGISHMTVQRALERFGKTLRP